MCAIMYTFGYFGTLSYVKYIVIVKKINLKILMNLHILLSGSEKTFLEFYVYVCVRACSQFCVCVNIITQKSVKIEDKI